MENTILKKPLVCGLLASLCCLLWGSAIPFINIGYRLFDVAGNDTATQLLFAGCRFCLAGALTVAIGSAAYRRVLVPRRENAGKVVKLALVQTVAQYVFFYIGVANTDSAKGSIIQGVHAFVSILVACYLFRFERMNRLKWLGGLLGVAGIVLVNLGGGTLDAGMRVTGEGFLLVSMFASACSAGMIRAYSQTENPVALSGWQFVIGGAMLIVCALLLGGRLSPVHAGAWGVLLYLAFLSAVAYSVWSLLLRVNSVSRVAVYSFLQPIFGVLLSLLLVPSGDAVPLLRYGVALLLVCLSIAIVSRGQREDA